MEIVKKLNLNKTPQAVDNNSLIFAKNIKLSNDGQYLTNEESLVSIASVLNDNEIIAGVIPTSKELVVFKYNQVTLVSSILRVKEKEVGVEIITVPNTWNYSGGKINGTYTYNVKNELIIAFGEAGIDKDIPLKTINLDTSKSTDPTNLYNIAPDIPICNCKFSKAINGSPMPNGIYFFFIRYEISNDIYTKWFPIGAPYYALNMQDETIIDHVYKNGKYGSTLELSDTFNNNEVSCPYNFELNLLFSNSANYINYQIGYILQHEDAQVGRLWKKFTLNGKTSDTIIFNADKAEEYAIEQLIEDTYNIFNVENIYNYGNRLYISNYKETSINVDLTSLANKIKVNYTIEEINNSTTGKSTATFIEPKNSETGIQHSATFDLTISSNNIYRIPFNLFYNDFAINFTINKSTDFDRLKISDGKYIMTDAVYISINANDKSWKLASDVTGDAIPKETKLAKAPGQNLQEVDTLNLIYVTCKSITTNLEDTTNLYTKYINKKTLIPNQVYNFFIHYIYSDGSHTNGIRIPNTTSAAYYDFSDGTSAEGLMLMNSPIELVTTSIIKRDWLKTLCEIPSVKSFRVCDVINNFNDTNKTFGYYVNNNNESMFKAPDVYGNNKIGASFSNITIPNGYIGFFISYEKVENIVQYECMATSMYRFVASDVQMALNSFNGVFYKQMFKQKYSANQPDNYVISPSDNKIFFINGSKVLSPNSLSMNSAYNNQGQGPSIYMNLEGATADDISTGEIDTNDAAMMGIGQVFSVNKYIYTSTIKDLVRLGGTIYKPANGEITNAIYSESTTYSDFNYPGYIVNDRVLVYNKKGVHINDDGTVSDNEGKLYANSADGTNENKQLRYAYIARFYKYCNYNLFATSIKKKPEILVNTINNTTYTNSIVKPMNSLDLFEFSSEWIIKYLKVFAAYNANNKKSIKYSKTIRRSDVIRSESAENSWRYFRADAYKIITENKGNITNIAGVGLYLLVHTEHSLFMFNRDASMKTQDKDIQLYIPDAFDTEYQEVFTSDKGYGGLQQYHSWVINEHGYTFYDKDAKQLYNFDNGQLNIMSNDIIQFIRAFDMYTVNMVSDNANNRLIICFEIKEFNRYVTISFNYLTNSYISLHDYYFNEAWNTKNNCYLFGLPLGIIKPTDKGNLLYSFKDSKTIGIYGELQTNDNTIFPSFHNDDGDISYSVMDIIFNLNYETIKSLEYINYVLSELLEYTSYINQAEEQVNRKYSGYQLRLYSDTCRSQLLDINVDNLPNKFNNYKYPFYEKGKWNLNYFRNYIESAKADNQSLIYGKYIVASFIFNNDSQKKVKLENINFGLNRY